MKKTSLLLMAAILTASCEKSAFNQSEYGNGKTSQVDILTRSAVGSSFDYPLTVYAFNSDGTLKASQTISSQEEQMSLTLNSGQSYRIVAITAPESDYTIEDAPDITSVICIKSADKIADKPMGWGLAEIIPSSEKSTVAIHMGQRMASVSIALAGLPSECSEVSVSVQSVAQSMTLEGENRESGTAHIKCGKNGDKWQSVAAYLLPSDTEQTIFTISYKDNGGDHFCSVTYNGQLDAGTPYNISGTFADGGINLTGNISMTGWNESINLNFSFGPGTNTVIDSGSNEDDGQVYKVSQIPSPATIWEGHVVVITDSTSRNSATLTLLSLSDWGDMTASTHAATPDMARSTASAYQEFDLKNWRIPTEDEARALFNAYNNLPLAQVMTDAGGDEIVLTEKSNNVRYLCHDASRTYSYKVNSILDAGASAKNYHLRLVRKVKVILATAIQSAQCPPLSEDVQSAPL
ncbi:MAG: FimB/Mfa2 family fimbrial subunit [Bacteroidaceae bacterium]|nr:FimB/Mfa2 family fimbrial subunit [Bacteroidaceae bacterium]